MWTLGLLDHVELLESTVREKVIKPDFRCPMVDGRLDMARLCALQGRDGEAVDWLGKARALLAEQGARPLLAIADFDEALICRRRGNPDDAERARLLLKAARAQFEAMGMTGWVRRADAIA